MKTTIEIPDALFRRAKARAAEEGRSLKELVTDALRAKLAPDAPGRAQSEPEWMQGFGKLRRLRRETVRVQARIDETFESIEAEDRL